MCIHEKTQIIEGKFRNSNYPYNIIQTEKKICAECKTLLEKRTIYQAAAKPTKILEPA